MIRYNNPETHRHHILISLSLTKQIICLFLTAFFKTHTVLEYDETNQKVHQVVILENKSGSVVAINQQDDTVTAKVRLSTEEPSTVRLQGNVLYTMGTFCKGTYRKTIYRETSYMTIGMLCVLSLFIHFIFLVIQ